MAVEMKVAGIALDAVNKSPILVLRDLGDRRALPIWIGRAEASAIMQVLEGHKTARPMTHDLLINSLEAWGLKITKIIIYSLQDSTFYAIITLERGEERKEMDARPSDAIALALRTRTPIWATEEVIAQASLPVDQDADEAEREAFRDFLDQIRPSDFVPSPGSDGPQADWV